PCRTPRPIRSPSWPFRESALFLRGNMIAGIILAAGESSRMGRDKALLPLGRETFLGHLIEVLRGEVRPLVVVLGHHAEQIEEQIARFTDVQIVRNPNYKLGQLSSLQAALRVLASEPVAGAVVCLVDHPAVTKGVVRALLDCFEKHPTNIVIPTCQGRRGHPALFPARLFPEFLDAPLDGGARVVVRRHAAEVELVETGEEGILLDVDRPADYAALLERSIHRTEQDKP
ncbi:MAG: nucleotidyltransferase family protein, partial [Terriglobia bacterium]